MRTTKAGQPAAMSSLESIGHPGGYLRRDVLRPKKLSVTEAAKLLGVSRPTLSNLLNGNASLSADMAVRFEKSFGVNRETLLQMQASYDELQTRERAPEIAVRSYAPSLMDITASQIAAWAGRSIRARQLLPAFVRRLIQSTGSNLTQVDFPAFDNAERPGWDGRVAADSATPWIPSGLSGWEFGCNLDPRAKAEADYKKRVATVSAAERKNMTFVFVTPHNWAGKNEWISSKRADKEWKDVRAFDASDLEQWLEQSVPTQAWMAEELGNPSTGVCSLEVCWRQWAEVTEPELSKELFRGSVDVYRPSIEQWLQQPPANPFVIKAPSREEGLAFIAAALDTIGAWPGQFHDRAIAIRSVDGLRKVVATVTEFIAVLASSEVEAESAGLYKAQHTIIIRTRGADEGEPNISLDLIDDKTFNAALHAMGRSEDEVSRLTQESGQSATVLRRRLSKLPAIKVPPWAQSKDLARKLIPLCFVGAWDAETKADQEILSLLADEASYSKVEEAVSELLNVEQTPVWTVAKHRGVVSKVDVLYSIHSYITVVDLERFFFTARYVLSEQDPALDLPEEKRWLANLYGKSRNHSRALRDGICETLVLLAVHGHNLFLDRGINVRTNINDIVRGLLTPLDARTWASQQSDLPLYAEAAPEEFIAILEKDLETAEPQVLSLLKPASSAMFGSCPRSGLLWALEGLAWKPERLLPIANIMARLSEQKINDNWANKPERSLESLFSYWVPQTAAPIGERLAVLDSLRVHFPTIVWWLCMEQLDPGPRTGSYSHRPRWRNDAFGAGQFAPEDEMSQTRLKALDIAVNWEAHDERTLSDLVERLHMFPDDAREKVWTHIRSWAATNQADEPRALLRENIRRFAFTRRGRSRKLGQKITNHAQELYDLLTPKDIVVRHKWLFAQQWVDESMDDDGDGDLDVERHERKIGQQRSQALRDIWKQAGYEGILRLCESGDAAWVIGSLLADGIITGPIAIDFIFNLASEGRSEPKVHNCIHGFLRRLDDELRQAALHALIKRFVDEGQSGEKKTIRILTAAPFRQVTWCHLETLSANIQQRYWREVLPHWDDQSDAEMREIIDRLLAVERPRAALSVVHMNWKALDSGRFVRLLREVATSRAEPVGHYQLSSYEISRALKVLNKRPDVSRDELAQLEFIFLQILDHTSHGIPNLELQLTESPGLFMQAIGLTFRRSDSADDPVEWLATSASDRDSMVTQMYTLLTRLRRIPGTRPDGTIDIDGLRTWIVEARALCRTYAREEVGDRTVGGLLAHCKTGEDGIWPCEPVRKVLEEVASKEIGIGMMISVHNARGATWRGAGGQQERDIAAKYRGWSKAITVESPFVSGILEQIAQSFERDAQWHDSRENLRRRLPY
jgi:addiction module HigA family antidote